MEDLSEECRGIDAIIHLASVYDLPGIVPQRSLIVNGEGTLKMLEAAKISGVKKFIYFSTVHVYGSPLCGTITEETLPRPVAPYAISHRVAEDFVLAAHSKGEITGLVLRLSNSFGCPNKESPNAWMPIINNMCKQAVETGTITLKNGCEHSRDFITVFDVCRCVDHFLNLHGSQVKDGLFNLGGEFVREISQAAHYVQTRYKQLFGENIEIINTSTSCDYIKLPFRYDISKLKSTGFSLSRLEDRTAELDSILFYLREAHGVSS